MSKILNILNTAVPCESNDVPNISTSMTNTEFGICPKCAKSMSSASIASGEIVFYCESCRVALPKPNTD